MVNSVDVFVRLDVDLTFSLKKLLNLNKFLVQIITGKHDNQLGMKNNFILLGSYEKILALNYLSGILDSEVKELKDDLYTLQIAHQKISPDGSSRELNCSGEEKLNDCEAYLKHSQEISLMIKMQSDKMQEAILSSRYDNWENGNCLEYSVNSLNLKANKESVMEITKQQKNVLRMLDESLTRELDLEKKISEFKQNEEDLRLKLLLTEKVASSMEEASMFVSGRFLEAEITAELLMGISKDLVRGIHFIQCDLNRSIQREDDLKSKLHACMEQLKSCQNHNPVLESSNKELHGEGDYAELFSLRKKVKSLEEQLNESAFRLNQNEDLTNKNISRAEIRAESAEARASILTEVNSQLTEELSFIKGSKNIPNMGLLEKLRELEEQSFQAQASSEASRKQQIMLYSAILDMETLIGDLKSKLSIAESAAETTEENLKTSSDLNAKLSEKNKSLREKLESLKLSLCEANDEKVARAEYISMKTNHLLDLVKRVAFERGLIENKLHSVMKEKKYVVEKLKDYSSHRSLDCEAEESANSNCIFTSEETTAVAEFSTEITKAVEVSSESESTCSSSTKNGTNWNWSMRKAIVLWLILVMISYLFIF